MKFTYPFIFLLVMGLLGQAYGAAMCSEVERVLGREGRMQVNFDGIVIGHEPGGKELTCHLGFDKALQDQLIVKGSFYQDQIWWAFIDLNSPLDGIMENETLYLVQGQKKNPQLCGSNFGNGTNVKKILEIKKGSFRLGISFTCLAPSDWPLGEHHLEVVCNLEEE